MSGYLPALKDLSDAMEAGDSDKLKTMHRQALIELEIYKTLPCNGRLHAPPMPDRDRRCVSSCDTEFAGKCQMRDHRACPRLLREAMGGRYGLSKADRSAELRRALVPGAIAHLIGHELEVRTKAIAAAEAWCDSRKRILVLSGGPRGGKTVAACWTIRKTGKSALFFNPTLLTQYGADRGYQDRMMSCGLLIVDDVGTESMDEAGKFASRFDVMVCSRFDAGERTVITTNLAAGVFVKRYGDRIAARVQTGGKFEALGTNDVPADREPGSDDE